ncbi:MAG: ABC transporter substrate-binding protein [Janthinobacterium lividum]
MVTIGVSRRQVLAGSAATMLAASRAHAAAGELTIGCILPLSGTYANQGAEYQAGIKTFQAMHGTSVGGLSVKIVYRDDQGPASGDLSRRVTQELIVRDKANVILGYAFTPNAMSSAALLTEAKVPAIIINAATSVITEKSPYFVRVSFTLPQISYVLGKYAAEHGIKTVYSIVSDYGPGLDAETWFKKGFEGAGGKIIGSARTPVSEMEYSPFLQRAVEAKPDAVFSFDPGGDVAVAFMKESRKRLDGTGIKLLVTGDLVEDDKLKLFGDAVKDVVSAHIYQVGLDNPANKAFIAKFRELYGADAIPNFRTVQGFDGIGLIYQAVTATKGDLASPALMAALKGATVDSPRGKFMIDPDSREAVQTVYIRNGQQVGGQWQNVEIAAYPAVKDPAKDPALASK